MAYFQSELVEYCLVVFQIQEIVFIVEGFVLEVIDPTVLEIFINGPLIVEELHTTKEHLKLVTGSIFIIEHLNTFKNL